MSLISRMLVGILLLSVPASAESPKPGAARLKVAIDPGHGGDDTGAKGPKGLLEKELCLELAEALRGRLEAAGLSAILTRPDDAFLALADRAKVANAQEADLFLSLHFNAARSKGAKGSEVYFLSLDQGDEDVRLVAERENAAALPAKGSEDVVASILDDLSQKAFLEDSQRLAVAIQLELNRLGNIKQRGVKQAPFAVLRRAAMPAVLVEAGFISNPKEADRLRDPRFLDKVAEAITRGVRAYLGGGRAGVKRKAYVDPA